MRDVVERFMILACGAFLVVYGISELFKHLTKVGAR